MAPEASTKDENGAAHCRVIPAQAGIHSSRWMPAFAGMTTGAIFEAAAGMRQSKS
jgi:hypothetical protein